MRRAMTVHGCATVVLAAQVWASVAWSQAPAPAPAPGNEPAPSPAPASAPAPADEPRISFNLKSATFDQFLDFFSRASGLSIIKKDGVPEGTVDYFSPESYTLSEGLEIANIILQARGYNLRVQPDENLLYLKKLEGIQTDNLPTYNGDLPEGITPSQIVTVVRPLEVALAGPLAEKLAPMVDRYGAITPLEQQNSLVITETAAQVRRLLKIISDLDNAAPEDTIEIFALRNARAADLMEPLKALLSVRVERFVPNPKDNSKMIKVEDESMPGLNISHDDRTNCIIAKGVPTRIAKLRETITLLDVPGGSAAASRMVRSYALAQLSPADAAAKLQQLFAQVPEAERPVVLASDDLGKVTVIGRQTQLAEAAALLADIDGGAVDTSSDDARSFTVVALDHADPSAVAAAVKALFNGRQLAATRLAPGPDGRSLIVSGPPADVAAVESLIPALDRPAEIDRQVRIARLAVPDGKAAVARAQALYDEQVDAQEPGWGLHLEYDEASRSLTMIGGRAALDRFAESLRLVEATTVIDRETRRIELTSATPSELIGPITTMAAQLLRPQEAAGEPFVAPQVDAIDALHALIVTALPSQMEVIESLVAALDQPGPGDVVLRAIPLGGADAVRLQERAAAFYETLAAGPDSRLPAPRVEIDFASGNLLITGRAEAVAAYEQALAAARQLMPPPRSGRMVELKNTEAAEVAAALADLVAATEPVEPGRRVPPPTFGVIARTNSLYVTAEPAQHQMIDRFVERLDTFRADRLPPLKLLQVRTVEAVQLAGMLEKRYGARPLEERLAKPVEVDADAATNALIVTAPPDVFEEIRALVDGVNLANQERSDRETMLFPLKRARAVDLAPAIDRLYPQPPMPVDRRGAPMPHLQLPKEIQVSADQSTNTLIIDAPAGRREQFTALVEQLDRVQLPPQAELRTWHIEYGDVPRIAATLQDLARRGVMNAPPEEGTKPVEVIIQAEPLSRTLIVAGDEMTFQKTEQVLKELEEGPPPEFRLVPLEYANAAEVVEFLRDLVRSATISGFGGPEPAVEAIERTNSVLVGARPEQHQILRELVRGLDKPGSQDVPPLRILQLRTADAANLAAALQNQYDRRHPDARKGQPVSITADPNTNTLILAAHPDIVPEIKAIVDDLNRADLFGSGGREIRIFPLQVARAEELARTIDEMFPPPPVPLDARGRPLAHLQQPREVVVRADTQTNALIVDAPVQRMAGFQELVEQLDRQQITEPTEVRTYHVLRADLAAVASTLQELSAAGTLSAERGDRRTPTSITVEPVSRTIVVAGSSDVFARVEQVLAELDAPPEGPATALRFFTLQNARAETIVPMMREVLLRRLQEDVSDAGARGADLLSVSADRMTNTLIVSAPQAVLAVAQALVAQLDHPRAAAGAVDVRIFPLKVAQAASVATTVRDAVNAKAAADGVPTTAIIVAEPSSNAVVVTAAAADIAQAESMISALDGSPPAAQVQVRTVFLKHARAEYLAPLISQLLAQEQLLNLDDLPGWARVGAWQTQMQQGGAKPDVRVAPDPRLNAVVVSAPPALLNLAEQMIAQLDVDKGGAVEGSGRRSVRVIVVENADAATLAANLEAVFADDQADAAPAIRVDAASNTLIVVASDRQYQTMTEVVKSIDRATIATSRQMRTIPIDPATGSAADLARTLRRILDRGGSGGIEVITLEELIKRQARPEAKKEKEIGSLLRREKETRSLFDLRGAVLLLAFAAAPAPAPQENKPGLISAAEIKPGLLGAEAAITIAVDEATNSLVVIGAPRSVDRIADLARQLLEQVPAAPGKLRYIALPPGADASSVAQLVMQTIGQLTPVGGARGDLQRRCAVLADPGNNALIIAANDLDFDVLGELIAAVSRPAATEAIVVKVYPLETITAERAVQSVQQLLDPDAGARLSRGRQAQRMRDLAVTLMADGQTIEGVFDPDRVRVTADGRANSLIVMGPPAAIGFIDQFVELLDQRPANTQATLKLYTLDHARAEELQWTLRSIFQARHQSMQSAAPGGAAVLQPEFASDDRTNTLLVTASPEQLAEVDGLLRQLDRPLGDEQQPLRTIKLAAATAREAADLLTRVVIGTDQSRRASTLIVPDDATGTLMVRAPADVSAEIDSVLAEIDRPAVTEFKVRTIVLERADANAVAAAMQKLYDDRARIASSGRGRRQEARRVSVIGDPNSNTILVAANDADFEEIKELAARFDSPEASQALEIRFFDLKHAKATEIESTVQQLVNDLTWNQGNFFFWDFWGGGGSRNNQKKQGTVAVRADARLNAIIATGEGDKFAVVEKLIDILDAPAAAEDERYVHLYRLSNADVQTVADVVQQTYTDATRDRRWWMPPDPTELRVRSEPRSRTLIIYGSKAQHEEIAGLIATIDKELAPAAQEVAVLSVEFARAPELAETLGRFLRDRARAAGGAVPTATIAASESANTLIVSAEPPDLATIRDLLSRLDQPDVAGDRAIEIVAVHDGNAEEIARIIDQQFGPRGRGADPAGGGGKGVIVTPDVRTNSRIVNAPTAQFAQAIALIERLDSPDAADETIIRTYALTGARAEEAVRILSANLQLDDRGETRGIAIRLEGADAAPVEVKAKVTADRRSNSVVVTATEESFPIIEALLAKIDDVAPQSPIEYRIIALQHAIASDVAYTLDQLLLARAADDDGGVRPRVDYNRLENQLVVAATADQFKEIERVVAEIDQPSTRQRQTVFVPLRFAQAEQVQKALSVFYGPLAFEADTPEKLNARIVADPASNSLVITADASEWEPIKALLAKLDSEEYDASLQLRVIPLTWADSTSVAAAINEAFAGELERRGAGRGAGRGGAAAPSGGGGGGPAVLVASEEWVRASAEPLTNSVIVSASLTSIRKIERIVAQLDVADFAKLPPPRIIPVTAGSPDQLAASLQAVYERSAAGRGAGGGGGLRSTLRIVGDQPSNSIIVRAPEEDFIQIKALAEALQQEASHQGLAVHVVQLRSAPAARVAAALAGAYEARASQSNQPFRVEVDRTGNSLVVACTGALFADVLATVNQLDQLAPAAGQSIFIIELEHVSPGAAADVVKTIGLDQSPRDDSVARLVSEPITITPLAGRNAVVVVANPVDRDVIVGLLKAIDSEPALAESQVRLVHLEIARAEALALILQKIFTPGEQQAETPLAKAVQEQVRRLSVRAEDGRELRLDLTKPIHVVADAALNALVISSTAANVDTLVGVVKMFDRVPITDAVTVQLFPLTNIAADQFARIVNELFSQGKALGDVAGTDLKGIPGGTVGRALLEQVAISVDERTNTVIVAGKEDAVALVEVLVQRIDTDVATGWIEPRVVPLKWADATELAETLHAILVEGSTNLPGASPLQRQVARMRLGRMDRNGGHVLEADIFTPMERLVIRPEPALNALILVGTPANLEVVTELAGMLDVEAASPGGSVRVYPVAHASAGRLATTIARLFDQQLDSGAIQPEDRVVISADERTNALVVTTSPRSFSVLEPLLENLDRPLAPELGSIHRIELVNASPGRVAQLVSQVMDARLERLRETEPETAELQRATVVEDLRTNSLLVAAGAESFEVIARLVADLDRAAIDERALVEVLPVKKANAERIAEAVSALMQRRYAELPADERQSQTPLVLTDPRSNSLLVAASPEDCTAIAELVKRLDEAPGNPAVGLHVLPLQASTRAEVMAPRVQTLMRQRQQSMGPSTMPSDRVTIEPDVASNSLIVAASDENLDVVRALISALLSAEVGATGGSEFEVIPLIKSRASQVVQLLEDLYVGEANRARGRDTVQVTADDRINAVLVKAPPQDISNVRRLVAQLDGIRPNTVVEIKFLPLESANCLETVNLIENVLSGRSIGTGRASQQATVLKYLREFAAVGDQGDGPERLPDTMEVSAAIRESISLWPDMRTNTVVVSAPNESINMIERMIRDLDDTSTGAQNIRIFKLKNADAVAMAEILSDLFQLRMQGNMYVLKPRDEAAAGGAAPGAAALPAIPPAPPGDAGYVPFAGTELTAVPDERQQLSLTVDARTNSLLVSGSPNYLDLVDEVVTELDALEANEREVFVYPLRNSAALDVSRVITQFVDTEQQKLVGTLSPDQVGSAARLLEREITIVGDDLSNTVLVSASPRYMQRVKSMIDELDIDPPQVLIQVLLAEISLDATEEWAVDFNGTLTADSVDFTGDYGLGALGSAFLSALGVPSLTVSGSDFELILRALQAQGRLQVLSNPSVMAANNKLARIQVGENIGRASSSALSEGGTQQTNVDYLDIGVILEVTPSINPDGFVRMTIMPEITDLTNRTTQVTEDLAVPVLTKRTATTTVTVRDGQTIVLGGLISDEFEKRIRKVPLLGDLPLLGILFRSEFQQGTTTELLIVLTPHVITSPADTDRVRDLTEEQIDRLSLTEQERESMRKSTVTPVDRKSLYGDVDRKETAPENEPEQEPQEP